MTARRSSSFSVEAPAILDSPTLPAESLRSIKNIVLISTISWVIFGAWLPHTIIFPFLPEYLKNELGVSGSVTGILFAVYPGFVLITSPFFGYLSERIGPLRVLSFGLLLLGGSTILFGILDHSIVAMFIFRSLQGIGSGATGSIGYSLVPIWFPNNTGAVMGFAEAAAGLGYAVGPLVGGALFSAGFDVPFFTLGALVICLIFLVMFANYYYVKPQKEREEALLGEAERAAAADGETGAVPTIRQLLTKTVVICVMGTMLLNSCFAFMEPTFEGHAMSSFGTSVSQTGLLFAIIGAAYIFVAPVVGVMSERYDNGKVMFVGAMGTFLGLGLMGPAPFIENAISDLTWLRWAILIISELFIAASFAMAFIPALPYMVESISEHGGAGIGSVSGIFNSSTSGGQIIGEILGAYIADVYGFNVTALAFGVVMLIFSPLYLFAKPDKNSKAKDLLDKYEKGTNQERKNGNPYNTLDGRSEGSNEQPSEV